MSEIDHDAYLSQLEEKAGLYPSKKERLDSLLKQLENDITPLKNECAILEVAKNLSQALKGESGKPFYHFDRVTYVADVDRNKTGHPVILAQEPSQYRRCPQCEETLPVLAALSCQSVGNFEDDETNYQGYTFTFCLKDGLHQIEKWDRTR